MRPYLITFLFCCLVHTVFSQVYIPYRDGKHWGLADTLGRVVVQPVYDELETASFQSPQWRRSGDLSGGSFFIKKDGHYGFIRGRQVVMPTVHGRLYLQDSLLIIDHYAVDDQPTVGSSRDIVYNVRGEKVIPDSINSIEFVPHQMDDRLLYVIRAPHRKSALIWYDPVAQKVAQWIVSDASFVNIGGSYEKDRLHLFLYTTSDRVPEKKDLVFNKQTGRYVVVAPSGPREEPRLTIDDGIGRIRTLKTHYVLQHFSFSLDPDEVNISVKTSDQLTRKEITSTFSYSLQGGSAEVKKFLYDATHWQWYSTKPYNDFEIEKLDSLFEYENYVQFKKNGKFGLICGKTVIKPIYDSIAGFKHIAYNVPYFIVAKRSADHHLKWGLISANNKVIIPCIYDELFPQPGGWFWPVRQGKHFGLLYAADGKVRLPVVYDQIISPDSHGFGYSVKLNGKYGYVDERVLCKPVFSVPVQGWRSFQDYRVFYVKDSNDHFSSYFDHKGFSYFKDI